MTIEQYSANVQVVVYDYMYRATPKQLAEMKARGATGVVRYLDPYNQKCIQRGEDVEIHSAGLELHLVFEIGGAGPFTFPEGVQDCMDAERLIAERLTNPPKHLRVYFAADINVNPSLFDPYANGIESAQTDSIDPGVYGYQRLIEWAAHNYPQMGTRLWQTYGTPTAPLDLWQHEQITLDSGLTVDVNDSWVHGWRGMNQDDVIALLASYGIDRQKVPAIDEALANFSFRINALEHGTPATPSSPAPTQPVTPPAMPTIYRPGVNS